VGVRILFFYQNFYLYQLGAHAKFPTKFPSVVLNNGGPPKKNKNNKLPKIVATFVYASSQGQRTHTARTKNMEFFISVLTPAS
jgi:hypothetical protein